MASNPTTSSKDDENHLANLIRKFVTTYDDPDIYDEVLKMTHYRLPLRRDPCTQEEKYEIITRVKNDWYLNEMQWRRGLTEQQIVTKCRTSRSYSGSYLYHDISTGQLLTYTEFERRYYSYISASHEAPKINDDVLEVDSSSGTTSESSGSSPKNVDCPGEEEEEEEEEEGEKSFGLGDSLPTAKMPSTRDAAGCKRGYLSMDMNDENTYQNDGKNATEGACEKCSGRSRKPSENEETIIIENQHPGETRVPFENAPESPVMIADFDEDILSAASTTDVKSSVAITSSPGSSPSPMTSITSPLKKQRVQR
jgi:hypothetical protein